MGSLTAQSFTAKLNPSSSHIVRESSPQDTIRILAVMVDFQTDNDGSTFGNGKFGSLYSKDYGTEIIDPLPHDINYFNNHFLFLKNYYQRVSGNQLNISYAVLPEVVTVSKTMRNYSPPPLSEDLTPVAEFAEEVWTKADSMYPTFQFSKYDVFFILHAGAGRDITLPGSLGNERDLPSVYLGTSAFEKLIPGFSGFPAGTDNFRIMNSAIIPETESRELSSFGTTFLFELSINGLMAATLASHLGLPDLFDTESGLSAIGRFGLMDGQAIFAYNGLFPPEPSAWEKIYLGWEIPVAASLNRSDYNLVPAILDGSGTTVLKVNLSSSEYFLLENRQRDARSDGAVVTYISGGQIKTRTFTKDTTGFYSYDIDSLEGVVIDVDEYDWALPGSGIVIWHIDENIININIEDNRVNADPGRRGVDVEEADGIQDIGVEFQTIFGDIIIGEGEQRDLWFASNDADLFKNRFSRNTRPDTKTNSDANSLLTISGFSDISNNMSFRITYGDSIIKPVLSASIDLPQEKIFSGSAGSGVLAFSSEAATKMLDREGNLIHTLTDFSEYKPAAFLSGDTLLLTGANNVLKTAVLLPSASQFVISQFPLSEGLTSTPLIVNDERLIAVGAAGGKMYLVRFPQVTGPFLIDSVIFQSPGDLIYIAAGNDYYCAIAKSGAEYTFLDNHSAKAILDVVPSGLLLTKNSTGEHVAVVISEEKFIMINSGKVIAQILKDSPSAVTAALTDLKQDGNSYLAFNDGNNLKVYNLNGFPADNFPYSDPEGKGFDSYILAADFEGDNSSEIIASTLDGRIFAFDGKTGKIVDGFPVSAGRRLKTHPLLYNNNGSTFLAALDSLNNLFVWNISSVPATLYWQEMYGNPQNTSFLGQPKVDNYINTFFPKEKVYNYPNPAYENKTYIRYYVAEDSRINIRIFDLAGALVEEINTDASGGSDNETEWNLSSVQSGVYLARIEASGTGGKNEINIIKIAVVK